PPRTPRRLARPGLPDPAPLDRVRRRRRRDRRNRVRAHRGPAPPCPAAPGRVSSERSGDAVRPSVSVKDVARTAGVSLGTVSNVRNHPDRVRETTRERVEAAIRELGFVRNESARQLRAGRSRMLAYLVPSADNPFFTDVARGAREAAR